MNTAPDKPMDYRTMVQGQVRELLQGALACLDEIDGSVLVPPSAMTMCKSLEFAVERAKRLADMHVSSLLCVPGGLDSAAVGSMDSRTRLEGETRELLKGSMACLDESRESELIPVSVMTMAKSLEYATHMATQLAEWHVSSFDLRAKNDIK